MEYYGVPYKGSKAQIADWVVEILPPGEVLVDLFAGGYAVTHAALLSGKWDRIIMNDITPVPGLFLEAIAGKYSSEDRWISREDFARLKDTDPYVATCWSFGSNIKDYMYSREVEPWKRALHCARVWGDTSELKRFGIDSDGSRADVLEHHDEYKRKYIEWYMREVWLSVESYETLVEDLNGKIERTSEELRQYLLEGLKSSGLTQAEVQRRLGTQMAGHYFGRSQWEFPTKEYYEQMQTFMPALNKPYERIYGLQMLMQRLQSLQSLQSLQRLQRLQRLQSDYRSVNIPRGAVVYCDPPYRGTDGYQEGGFDHEAFYSWLKSLDNPVYISEYSMPEGFKRIAVIKKRSLLGDNSIIKPEGIWVPEGQKEGPLYLFDNVEATI